jgi:hypothetical protein
LWLVKNGVPWDVAEAMDDDERLAACIVFGRFEGNRWNWDTMAFEKPST